MRLGDCQLRDDMEFCEKVGVSRKDGGPTCFQSESP